MPSSSRPTPFDPSSIRRFRFVDRHFDSSTATVSLEYALDDRVSFVERIAFPGATPPAGAAEREALDRCLEALHLVAGVSYYKTAAPPEISIETGAISGRMAEFCRELYLHGLGEFSYVNELDLDEHLRFPGDGAEREAVDLTLPRRSAVPIGGGKDSIVTLEALRAAGEPMTLFSVGDFEPIRRTAEVSGLDRWIVQRKIDAQLGELNRAGALNGHVPISAIIAFILATAAVLYGFDRAALSNESSADEPDLEWRGRPINHEYSKSFAFERAADDLIGHELVSGFRYFSLLRPLSELSIASLFAPHAEYRSVFRSCNAAYRQSEAARAGGWCGDCPKCRFVFLVLAPFVPKAALIEVFGADLLAEEAQAQGYAALLGETEHRPLECVGGELESRAAFALLDASAEWGDATLVRRFSRSLPVDPRERRKLIHHAMTPTDEHRVPEGLRPVLASLEMEAREERDRVLATLDAVRSRG